LGRCRVCGEEAKTTSEKLGVCLRCIRVKPEKALVIAEKTHGEARQAFNLPAKIPAASNGLQCGMCANDCRIGINQKGFCGLVMNVEGRLVRGGGTPEKGVLEWYYDPLPTNCVAWWFCPGCTGAGYPKYAHKPTAETEYANLAVFYGACSLDCLFCQNWHYRRMSQRLDPVVSAENLAQKVDSHVSCICFFGGDPSVQMPHALKTSQIALEKAAMENRILRVCWETNGNMRKEFAEKAAELSFITGGVVKFDLKAWDENLHRALCGVPNKRIFENFKMIGYKHLKSRSEVPLLTASTLLVPGYVDEKEVENIARFIAEIDPQIPYTLLAFYPQFEMNDLPTTSRTQAAKCVKAAERHLRKVRIGNIHLLS
jgi:pyruvate formate lyase activating enzyme